MKFETMISADGSEMVLCHFLCGPFPGAKSIVCMPGLNEKEMCSVHGREVPLQRTEDPRAVNCPMCKKTLEFKQSLQLQTNVLKLRATMR